MTRRQPQPAPHDSLESLMEAYQQADEQAFTELARRLSPQLLVYFRGPHATRRHADDLLQDFWLRVHQARHTYEAGRPLLPWLYTIARYARTDAYRRMARGEQQQEFDADLMLDPKSLVRAIEARSELGALMANLPARQREVVLLLKARGLTLDETARATGSTIGATKQTAHRAYTNLRATAKALNEPTSYQAAAN
ncbi:MAG: sigma-70 family RNA polymerase sigma factor [Acidobacteria bacterium]|nr:sigma-70 family RNA polymerase sigma factor [Acidobacteriota bacterium]